MTDRTVHASATAPSGVVAEVVRYDRQGRWYYEARQDGVEHRERIPTIHEAAQRAISLEQDGGEIFFGRPGGKHFDAKVAGARGSRRSRH